MNLTNVINDHAEESAIFQTVKKMESMSSILQYLMEKEMQPDSNEKLPESIKPDFKLSSECLKSQNGNQNILFSKMDVSLTMQDSKSISDKSSNSDKGSIRLIKQESFLSKGTPGNQETMLASNASITSYFKQNDKIKISGIYDMDNTIILGDEMISSINYFSPQKSRVEENPQNGSESNSEKKLNISSSNQAYYDKLIQMGKNLKFLEYESAVANFFFYTIQNMNLLFETIPLTINQRPMYYTIMMGTYHLLMIQTLKLRRMSIRNQNLYHLPNWAELIESEAYKTFVTNVEQSDDVYRLFFKEFIDSFDEACVKFEDRVPDYKAIKSMRVGFVDYEDCGVYVKSMLTPIIEEILKYLRTMLLDYNRVKERTILIVIDCINTIYKIDKLFTHDINNTPYFDFTRYYDNHSKLPTDKFAEEVTKEVDEILLIEMRKNDQVEDNIHML